MNFVQIGIKKNIGQNESKIKIQGLKLSSYHNYHSLERKIVFMPIN